MKIGVWLCQSFDLKKKFILFTFGLLERVLMNFSAVLQFVLLLGVFNTSWSKQKKKNLLLKTKLYMFARVSADNLTPTLLFVLCVLQNLLLNKIKSPRKGLTSSHTSP